MDYQLIDRGHQRQILTDQLRASESQHWTEVLRRIANPTDQAIQRTAQDSIAKLEAGISALRQELDRLDSLDAPSQQAAPAEGPSQP